jgi:copper chaperone CopZ
MKLPVLLRSLICLSALCLAPLPVVAADAPTAPPAVPTPASYTYNGEILGIACAACARIVTADLKKMHGVTSVKVIPGKQTGTATLEIKSTSPDLTKEAAVKAQGLNADSYPIQSLKRETKS